MSGDGRFVLPSAPIWRAGRFRFPLCRPYVMGILNVTPDSFSDGGLHDNAASAIGFALRMVEQGADIVDVGGESTRPGADAVTVGEELSRVLPVVTELAARGICVSIDTYHPEVAAACVAAGASIINDISGFRDPAMVEVAAGCDAGVIPMHMLGTPKDMQSDPRYGDVVGEVCAYLREVAGLLEAAGIAPDRICVDPGPGFGKNVLHNMQLLAGTDALARLGYPLIAAFSRKRSLGAVTGVEVAAQRVSSSATAAVLAYCGGARIFRVHDVAETVEALQVAANAAYAGAHPVEGLATMLPGRRAIVALGSNMPANGGDPVGNLVEATRRLDEAPGIRVIASSSVYQSEPAYYADQDLFANSAAWVQTTLEPMAFLESLWAIEQEFHRERLISNGPRTLDLDVLDFEGVVSDDPTLTLPHPRVLERDFTVTPLLELADAMAASFGRYVHPDVLFELGRPDGLRGGFRLADGAEVTREGIAYGKVTAKLLDAAEVM